MRNFIVKTILYITIIVSLLVAGLYGLAIGDVFGHIPDNDELRDLRLNLASEIWSADGKLIGKSFIQDRSESTFEDYPKSLVNALVATEDSRFYEHNGVDYISLIRVVFKTILLQDKSAGGGSTLTQQVAKNYFGRKSYGILTIPIIKVKEHILAIRMEDVYSKNEIIELYLNTVPFGEGLYGIQSASKRFFNKNIENLKTEEAAVLVGMLKANTGYNPRLNPERSLERRNTVLGQMLKNDYLNQKEFEDLKKKKLVLNYNSREKYDPAGYFTRRVKSEAEKILEDIKKDDNTHYNLETDGLQIKTTLNFSIQQKAFEALLTHLAYQQKQFDKEWKYLRAKSTYKNIISGELEKTTTYKALHSNESLSKKAISVSLKQKKPTLVFESKKYAVKNMTLQDSVEHYLKMLHGAIVSIDPKSGAVLAYIGGKNSNSLPYDLVYAKRQMASTFKPFVYASALNQGWKPCDYIDNSQKTYTDHDNWTPKNSDNKYDGYYSMKGALTNSVNVATVATYFRAGEENVNELVNKVGLSDEDLPDFPSVALGVESSNLMRMTSAYDIFAIDGKHRETYIIESISDRNGKLIYKHQATEPVEILSKEEQELMAIMLRSVIDNGTGRSLRSVYKVNSEFAGKTGTAQNYSDAWFIAFNPNIIVGVWSGFFNPNIHFQGANGYGSKAALPVFAKLINKMDKDKKLRKYTRAVFPPTSDKTEFLLDCPDYKEDNFFDRNFKFLEKNKTSTEREKKKVKNKSFWKKVFGKKKEE
ncbi:MAG: transglycosylase domain-containing protein [Bacteroidota bacterium]